MLTNKKPIRKQIPFLLMAVAAAWLAGCSPSGPGALLRGKRLIEEGKYAEAVEQLQVATSLLATNAQAWNYLGLAYHHSGQPAHALEAYERALKLNHDLVAVHYNLGCLLLEQNRPDTLEGARNELTAFTLHQGNVIEGWLKLGTAQLRLGELAAAEASYKEALRLNPLNVEALNDLGLTQLERRRTRDAAAYFNAALKAQPNYAPAMQNLAVTEIYLGNKPLALQLYQEYLALTPRASHWDEVHAAAQQLDQELNPPPRPAPDAGPTIAQITNNPNRPAIPPTNVSHSEAVAVVPRPGPSPMPNPDGGKLPDNGGVKVAGGKGGNSHSPVAALSPEDQGSVMPADSAVDEKPAKRGFLAKLNPMTLFRRPSKPMTEPTNSAPVATTPGVPINPQLASAETGVVSKPTPPPARPLVIPRYPYLSPGKPASGNHVEAARWLAWGGEAQRDHRLRDALAAYRSATLADPGWFEAQTALGSAAFDLGDMPTSLRAYELALAIDPDSFNARFNFGLALKKANYIRDAAAELEGLLASNAAGQSPANLAVVHLTLGNLYAEQFHQNAPARAHYLKVLELDPHNAQATAIRYWLQDNT